MSYLITRDETKIYFNDVGHGEPIVLIHGWPLSSDMWEYQRQALLDRGFRVISYDRRGFGKSSQPIGPYNYDTSDNPKGADEAVLNDMITQLKEDRPKFLAAFTKQFFGAGVISHPVSQEMMNWANFLAFQANPKATIDCVTAFGKTDFRSDMKAFTVPTLVIHGTSDKNVPIGATGDAAAKAISNVKYRRYEGAPHGLFITHKNQLIEDLLGFL
ncbi:MAG: alpha/beta hydrolase [Proteobacteria bacterium]|nr:MAG: alpha/beta hydrolase [Pseudomonadota bacterium]